MQTVDTSQRITSVSPSGTIERKTIFTVDDEKTQQVAMSIYTALNNNFENLNCNVNVTIESDLDYISVQRLCTDTNIDWIIVLAVPKWNYLGSFMIGIIFSIISVTVIISLAILISIIISRKIVKPFHDLIEQFDSISEMDLDRVNFTESTFSEVKKLQHHFEDMKNTIRIYRAFLPPHLLSQLDQGEETASTMSPPSLPGDRMLNYMKPTSSATSEQSEQPLENEKKIAKSYTYTNKLKCTDHLFQLFLEKKHVTIMQLLFVGFSDLLKHISDPNDCLQMLTDVFEQVTMVSRIHGGLIGSFENNSITMSFNATNHQPRHQEKGALAARLILDKLKCVKEKKWYSEFHTMFKDDKIKLFVDSLKMHVAVLHQECIVGNIGTKDVKNRVLISSATYNLEKMLQTACKSNLSIVVTDGMRRTVRHLFRTRYIDTLDFLLDNEYSSVVQILGYSDRNTVKESIYELGIPKQRDEEPVNDCDTTSKWKTYKRGVKYMNDGDIFEAISAFEEFAKEEGFENDVPTAMQIEKCLNSLASNRC